MVDIVFSFVAMFRLGFARVGLRRGDMFIFRGEYGTIVAYKASLSIAPAILCGPVLQIFIGSFIMTRARAFNGVFHLVFLAILWVSRNNHTNVST